MMVSGGLQPGDGLLLLWTPTPHTPSVPGVGDPVHGTGPGVLRTSVHDTEDWWVGWGMVGNPVMEVIIAVRMRPLYADVTHDVITFH